MKLLVLYEELAGYFLACVEEFADAYGCEVKIIRKEVNAIAPFHFNDSGKIEIIDRSNLNEKKMGEMTAEFSPDAIFCAGWAYKPYLEICRKYSKNIPVVLGFDNWWTGSMKQRLSVTLARSFFSKRFNRCFVPGLPQKEFALKLGFFEKAIARGAYACDFEKCNSYFQKFYKEKKESFPKRFIFSGRYVPEKGIDILWKAFAEIQQETPNEWELWCLGKGDLKPVEHPKIKHFGFVQPAEMENYFRQTGVFILPSIFEPWGVVAHEFAAAGFPLILSDKVGAAENFLRDGRNGFRIRNNDVDNLKAAMRMMIESNEDKLFAMGEHSNTVAKTITPQTWSKTLFDLINSKI